MSVHEGKGNATVEAVKSESVATLSLAIAAASNLQQVFTNGQGQFVVGETALGSGPPSGSKAAPFAPRIREALSQWNGRLTLLIPIELEGLPWVDWIKSFGVQLVDLQRSEIRQPPHSQTSTATSITLRSHRHISSISYDIVDSTVLMATFGDENYAQFSSAIHQKFAEIARVWGGQADLTQGDDGCMCHFGISQTFERSDLAALQAAWAMAQAAREQSWPVRFGLASGWVVVEGGVPFGLTVHLAARLQTLAPTQQIFVSTSMAQPCRSWFEFHSSEAKQSIKGFREPQAVSHLLGPIRAAARVSGLVESHGLIGRQESLQLLGAARSRAEQGIGTDVLLEGEPGIGKSSLIQTWLEHMHSAEVLTFRCDPHDQRQAFACIANWIARELEFSPMGTPRECVKQLEQCIAKHPYWVGQFHALRHLLGLPAGSDSPYEEPVAAHTAVVAEIVKKLLRRSEDKLVVVVVEDYHWIDGSSAEIFEKLRDSLTSGLHLMVLVSQRPCEAGQRGYRPNSIHHTLQPLPELQMLALVTQIAPSMAADHDFMKLVFSRANGIPLFLKECALLYNQPDFQGSLEVARKLGLGLPIPESLQQLLTSKLDRLGVVRQLAQVGSVLGDTFSFDLLELVSERLSLSNSMGQSLEEAHIRLVSEGIWSRRGDDGSAQIHFHHALVRDAAYQTMWETDRRRLHRVVTEVLTQKEDQWHVASPSQLARHLAAAGETEQAVVQLMRAGKVSKQLGAHKIAQETMETALELLDLLPDVQSHHRQRTEAHLAIAGQILVTKGYADGAVLNQFRLAHRFSESAVDHALQFRAMMGMQLCYFMGADFQQARRHLESAQQVANHVEHPMTRLHCEWAMANLEFYEGNLLPAAERMRQCIDQCQRNSLGVGLLQNPLVLASMYRAFSLACLGSAKEAVELAVSGCELASSSGNRLAKVQAYGIAAMVFYELGDWQQAKEYAMVAISSCAPMEYGLWSSHSLVMQGAAIARLDGLDAGLDLMRKGHQSWAAHGGVLTRSFYWAIEAELLADGDRLNDAREAINSARKIVDETGERYYASEVTRINAAINLRASEASIPRATALAELESAYNDAYCRQCYAFALRCASLLVEHKLHGGEISESDWVRLETIQQKVIAGGMTKEIMRSQKLLAQRTHRQVISLKQYRKF